MKRGGRHQSKPKRDLRASKIVSSESSKSSESEHSESSSDFVTTSAKKAKSSTSYIVEKIVDKRTVYWIKWLGYPNSENTWEPIENLKSCPEMVEAFEAGLEMTSEVPPDDASTNAKNEYWVEKILKKQIEYRVKYKGFPHSANEWQSEQSLSECPGLITDFEEQQRKVEGEFSIPSLCFSITFLPF